MTTALKSYRGECNPLQIQEKKPAFKIGDWVWAAGHSGIICGTKRCGGKSMFRIKLDITNNDGGRQVVVVDESRIEHKPQDIVIPAVEACLCESDEDFLEKGRRGQSTCDLTLAVGVKGYSSAPELSTPTLYDLDFVLPPKKNCWGYGIFQEKSFLDDSVQLDSTPGNSYCDQIEGLEKDIETLTFEMESLTKQIEDQEAAGAKADRRHNETDQIKGWDRPVETHPSTIAKELTDREPPGPWNGPVELHPSSTETGEEREKRKEEEREGRRAAVSVAAAAAGKSRFQEKKRERDGPEQCSGAAVQHQHASQLPSARSPSQKQSSEEQKKEGRR